MKSKERIQLLDYGLVKKLKRVLDKLEDIYSYKQAFKEDSDTEFPYKIRYGLCGNSGLDHPDLEDYAESVFETWKHYSGYAKYPVPSHDEDTVSAQSLYHEHSENKYVNDYGKLRFKLAKHLIKQIKKDLKRYKNDSKGTSTAV